MRSGRLWLAFVGLVLGVAAMAIWLDHGGARGTPIRVAFAGPLSGLSVEDGLAGVRAIELIFDQVNAAGGIGGRPLVLIPSARAPTRRKSPTSPIPSR